MSGIVSQDRLLLGLGHVYAGKPTEEVYNEFLEYLTPPPRMGQFHQARGLAMLVQGAGDEWYQRAHDSVVVPLLQFSGTAENPPWLPVLIRRDGVLAGSMAGRGRGMSALKPMLRLRNRSCTLHALLWHAAECFVGAGTDSNRDALVGYKQLIDRGFGLPFAEAMEMEARQSVENAAVVSADSIAERREAVRDRGRRQSTD